MKRGAPVDNPTMTDTHELPTAEWTHSHALEAGDKLETEHGEVWEVTTVQDDGAVRVLRVDDGRNGPNDRDTWGEEAARTSLAHGEMQRTDGLSHELATF